MTNTATVQLNQSDRDIMQKLWELKFSMPIVQYESMFQYFWLGMLLKKNHTIALQIIAADDFNDNIITIHYLPKNKSDLV